jgi:hypothetical protein
MFVDVEPLLSAWLKTATGVQCVTELPATLETAVPLIEVGRIGGADSQVVIDAATVDVTCWGATRDTARKLAYLVQDWLLFHLPGTSVPGGVVLRVVCVSGPAWQPYDNTAVRRVHALYQFHVQSHG